MSHPVKKSTRARRPPSYLTDNVYRDDEYEAEMNNHINSRVLIFIMIRTSPRKLMKKLSSIRWRKFLLSS